MRRYFLYLLVFLILSGCATTDRIRVTPLGMEPEEIVDHTVYFLPQTVLRIEVSFRVRQQIPGPYWEYAQRFLGLAEVIKMRSTTWEIEDVAVSSFSEPDPDQVYSLSVLEGTYRDAYMRDYLERGLILDGTRIQQHELGNRPAPGPSGSEGLLYPDRSIHGNFAERTETMYKTLVTDTSFVRVPVERTIVEQKSAARKAEEAADFLLELRTRRFELLTGEYEAYPDGVAMQAALDKLDELERSYLSLFTGKTITRSGSRAFFLVPEPGVERYNLGMFSRELGFVPRELMEGEVLQATVHPLGKTSDIAAYESQLPAEQMNGRIVYRIPDVVELNVLHGSEILTVQRISVYQSGALVRSPSVEAAD